MKIIKKTISITAQTVLGLLAGIGAMVSLGWLMNRTSEKSLNTPFAGETDTSMNFVNN